MQTVSNYGPSDNAPNLAKQGFFFSEAKKELLYQVEVKQEIDDILKAVQKNEACVYWYAGAYGLKQGAIDFYKPILSQNIQSRATPFLVDLSAWGAFKGKSHLSSFSKKMAYVHGEQIKVLKCSDFFNELKKISESDKRVFDLISNISQRKGLLEPSKFFEPVGISVGTVFKQSCSAIASLYELDCANVYSVIQYIEFLFLVENILQEKNDVQCIRFILPNDEAKYYLSTMKTDVTEFLIGRGFKKEAVNSLKIKISCFTYGEETQHRPYNSPGKSAPKKISLEDIVEIDKLEPPQPFSLP